MDRRDKPGDDREIRHHFPACRRDALSLYKVPLAKREVTVTHILSNGNKIPHGQIEDQLIKECGHGGKDFFSQGKERLVEAYRERSRRVSFRDPNSPDQVAAE
jgi:hypothetical protein